MAVTRKSHVYVYIYNYIYIVDRYEFVTANIIKHFLNVVLCSLILTEDRSIVNESWLLTTEHMYET